MTTSNEKNLLLLISHVEFKYDAKTSSSCFAETSCQSAIIPQSAYESVAQDLNYRGNYVVQVIETATESDLAVFQKLFPNGIKNRKYNCSLGKFVEIPFVQPSFWEAACNEAIERRETMKKYEAEKLIVEECKRNGTMTVVHQISVKNNDYCDESSMSLDDFITQYEPVEKEDVLRTKLLDGHFVDTSGYRGEGLWYYCNGELHKTVGEYGYFVTSHAWPKVVEHGLGYFKDTGALFVMIPDDTVIVIINKKTSSRYSLNAYNRALTIECGENDDEEYLIDGKIYQNTTLYELY